MLSCSWRGQKVSRRACPTIAAANLNNPAQTSPSVDACRSKRRTATILCYRYRLDSLLFLLGAHLISGLVKLFLFQAFGELVSNFLIPFIPGPVIGLVLLLVFLLVARRLPADIDSVGSGILQHLGLLFIPASVGVLLYLPILKANAWAVIATLLLSVIATIAVTGGLLKLIAGEKDEG